MGNYTMKTGHSLTLALKDNAALRELFGTKQPGDEVPFKIGDVEGSFVIDELLSDRVSGQIEGLGESDGEEEPETKTDAGASIGASLMAAIDKKEGKKS